MSKTTWDWTKTKTSRELGDLSMQRLLAEPAWKGWTRDELLAQADYLESLGQDATHLRMICARKDMGGEGIK